MLMMVHLDLQHYVMTMTIGGNHCLCPKNNGATRVLDLGTGTGIWAMEFGKHFMFLFCMRC